MARRITKIDGLELPDHHFLDVNDECYFFGEYSAREGYTYNKTNEFIYNLKKSVDRRNLPEWQYKENAIQRAAELLGASINFDLDITLVPVPPSKAKTDPLYDDRILRVLKAISHENLDIRELIIQRETIKSSHSTEERPSLQFLIENYSIDKKLLSPEPKTIIIVDDVLTTGRHFKAIKSILLNQFPHTKIIGIFMARTRRVAKP